MPEPPSIPYGLPRACYARHPTTGETIVLIRGQAGYWPADATGTPEQLNAELEEPPTQAQIEAMLGKSMFGWAEPVPDPKPARALSQGPDPGDTANWGGPDTPYRLKDGSAIWPLPLAMFDPLRALSGGHLGLYGWLGMVDRRIQRVSTWTIHDLPARDWRDQYDGRVPPEEAADVAVDGYASQHGV